MGAKSSGTFRKVAKLPDGEPFVWLTRELLCSDAWRGTSIHCRKLIDFLCLENMNHAGTENGQLVAPYDQLITFGIGRRFISEAIREAEARGLVVVKRGGKRNQLADHMNRYELTWLAAKRTGFNSSPHYVAPENNWKRITKQKIDRYQAEKKARKKQSSGAPMVNSNGTPIVNLPSAPLVNSLT